MAWKLIFIILFWTTSIKCLEFIVNSPLAKYPHQIPDPLDPSAFYRESTDNTLEKIVCPPPLIFNRNELKCTHFWMIETGVPSPRRTFIDQLKPLQMSTLGNGQWPAKENCHNFLNCWDGICLETSCNDQLLFNAGQKYCDWPLKAGCCEYWEEDSSQIVG